jgi:hypothetical protein
MTNSLGGSMGAGVPRQLNVKSQKHRKTRRVPISHNGMAREERTPLVSVDPCGETSEEYGKRINQLQESGRAGILKQPFGLICRRSAADFIAHILSTR